tara:strand:- start:6454 stop:6777 length:324 start_codon:yes stop_codon:yes gene_type:complete
MWLLNKLQSYGDKPIHKHAFYVMIYGSYILYAIAFTGILSIDPRYLSTLQMITQIYISLFLIIRFNPFVNKSAMTKLDRRIAYSAGVFLFLSSTAATIAKTLIHKLE